MQEDLSAIVGYNEIFNNVIVRHALDLKNTGIFQNPNPLNLTFCDVQKFDLENAIIGKLAAQVEASKLTEDQLTKIILMRDQVSNIENRLEELRKAINFNDKSEMIQALWVGEEVEKEAMTVLLQDWLVEMNLTT